MSSNMYSNNFRLSAFSGLCLIRLQRIYNFLIVPCYYLRCFGCLMGFVIHFYIIFGTNLLTQRPSPDCYFFAYFRVLQKRNIKQSPNGMKPSGEIFLEKITHWRFENHGVGFTWCSRGWGRPPRARPLPRGPHVGPLMPSFLQYIPMYPQNIKRG